MGSSNKRWEDNNVMILVVGGVPIKNEALVMTWSISSFAGLTRFFGGARRGRVWVRTFISVSVHSYIWTSVSVIKSPKQQRWDDKVANL